MRITISFSEKTDKDIIDYLKDTNRSYKIREAIRKAIKFDRMLDNALAAGLNSEKPKDKMDVVDNHRDLQIDEDLNLVSKDQKIPLLTQEEIEKKLDQF